MRPYLGPPRELIVRRLETDHRRANRYLASAMTIIAGVAMVIISVFTPHMSVGRRLVGLIMSGSAAAVALSFKRPSKRNVLGMLALAWTVVAATFAIW